MKASKLIAAVVSGAAALALVGGIAYAMEPDRDPATLPMPEAAQDTSIVKQVASIIVYEDQEEAVAMASEFDDIHDELAMDAVSSRASLSAKHSASHDASVKAAASATSETPEGSNDSIDVEAVDVTEPLETISPEGDGMVADSIDANGDIVTYVPSYESASAPASGAGLWMGSDSTTDGSWGYFIGHNPGDFTCVMTLKNGDPVTVCDSDGNTRTYSVVDEFIVPRRHLLGGHPVPRDRLRRVDHSADMLRGQRPLPRGHRRLEATATRSSPLPIRPVFPIGRLFAGRLRYPREALRNAPSRKDPHGTPRRYRPRLQFGSPGRLRDQAGRCRQALPHVGR